MSASSQTRCRLAPRRRGRGKSTLLHVPAGSLRPDRGQVHRIVRTFLELAHRWSPCRTAWCSTGMAVEAAKRLLDPRRCAPSHERRVEPTGIGGRLVDRGTVDVRVQASWRATGPASPTGPDVVTRPAAVHGRLHVAGLGILRLPASSGSISAAAG